MKNKDIIASINFSPVVLNKDNCEFVRYCYDTLLGREPEFATDDEAQLALQVDAALETLWDRAGYIKKILHSDEFEARVHGSVVESLSMLAVCLGYRSSAMTIALYMENLFPSYGIFLENLDDLLSSVVINTQILYKNKKIISNFNAEELKFSISNLSERVLELSNESRTLRDTLNDTRWLILDFASKLKDGGGVVDNVGENIFEALSVIMNKIEK